LNNVLDKLLHQRVKMKKDWQTCYQREGGDVEVGFRLSAAQLYCRSGNRIEFDYCRDWANSLPAPSLKVAKTSFSPSSVGRVQLTVSSKAIRTQRGGELYWQAFIWLGGTEKSMVSVTLVVAVTLLPLLIFISSSGAVVSSISMP
jgi:hypothetical protein